MSNTQSRIREQVHDKYNGKCAFCGHDLGKGWHCWDIEPIQTVIDDSGGMKIINTDIDNMMPACKPCGSLRIKYYDRKLNIEEFRKEIEQSFEFLRYGGLTSTSYGRAIRFGLIIETNNQVTFYFEQFKYI